LIEERHPLRRRQVLIGVSDDLGCLFYHLLENPMLCNIRHPCNTKPGTSHSKTATSLIRRTRGAL
jgi:hypothetical protein